MPICSVCNKTIPDKELRTHEDAMFCEDCYIDELIPKMPKSHYDSDSEFMNRLKDSYPVRKQQYH